MQHRPLSILLSPGLVVLAGCPVEQTYADFIEEVRRHLLERERQPRPAARRTVTPARRPGHAHLDRRGLRCARSAATRAGRTASRPTPG
jgi:hypothetical protein